MQMLRLQLSMVSILALTLGQALAGKYGHNAQITPEDQKSSEKSHASFPKKKPPQQANHKRKTISENTEPKATANGRSENKVREQESSSPSKKARTEAKIPLKQQVETIKEQIEEARQEANAKRIRELYTEFESLDYSERAWDSYARTHKLYRWPSQSSSKQTVGGHLFFPQEILDWEDSTSSPYFGYLAKRIDTIWSLAIGAKFEHAVGKLYLGKVLHEIYGAFTDADAPPLIDRISKEAFADLRQCLNNSNACYAIGVNREGPYYITHKYFETNFCGKKEAEMHQKGGDLRNAFQLLVTKQADKSDFGDQQPTFKDFWELGEQGYKPAYLEAALLKEEGSERIKVLKTIAKEKKYAPAWDELGGIYEAQGQLEKARKYYLKAAKKGATEAYIDLGKSYVDDITSPSTQFRNPLENVPQENIDHAIKYFTRAGDKKHQEGWKYLARLYIHILDLKVKEKAERHVLEDHRDKARSALQRGMALGSAGCYHLMYNCYRKDFQKSIQQYGYPPQERLRDVIEEFLYK